MTEIHSLPGRIIHAYPAAVYYEAVDREYRHGDCFAIPESVHRGMQLYTHFRLGSAEGYAREYGEDETAARDRAMQLGHRLYWANQCSTSLTAEARPTEHYPVHQYGEIIRFEGGRFRLERAANRNVELVAVGPQEEGGE